MPCVVLLSSKPVYQSHGLIMSHDIVTVTPSRAVTFRALQSLTLRAQGTRTYHIVKERSAYSLGYSVRFVWCRLNPRREPEPEAHVAGYVFQRCLGYRPYGALTGVTPRTYLHTDNRLIY